ncbi:hypothetical protein ACTWQF_24565 [Streptomyces sp. 8N114]|uniref:hypothetical protein n=1 Tax=Streptomyces sp. 8N114 TaxID=3457419 RepID=UPI003FD231FC
MTRHRHHTGVRIRPASGATAAAAANAAAASAPPTDQLAVRLEAAATPSAPALLLRR